MNGTALVTGTAILWPMIVHAGLVFTVYFLLGRRRVASVKRGEVKIRNYALNHYGDEPEAAFLARADIANQFELPVLFHIVCLALAMTGGAGWIAVVVAWIFTGARLVHAWIHLHSNHVLRRQKAFIASLFATIALWFLLALTLLGLPLP